MVERGRLSLDQARACYAILVREAGAPPSGAGGFVQYLAGEGMFGGQFEWRFQGLLGFGGKFYFDPWSGARIGCYREHETPERVAIIERVNGQLRAALLPSQEETAP